MCKDLYQLLVKPDDTIMKVNKANLLFGELHDTYLPFITMGSISHS